VAIVIVVIREVQREGGSAAERSEGKENGDGNLFSHSDQ